MGEIEDPNLAPLVACNFTSPMTIGWFKDVWAKYYPFLYTETDSPQCPECFEFDEKKKKALKDDITGYYALQSQKGVVRSHFHLFFNLLV